MTTTADFLHAIKALDVLNVNSWQSTYDKVAGSFVFDPSVTPLASMQILWTTLAAYVVISYTLNFIVGERPAREKAPNNLYYTLLKYLGIAHNFNMMMISVVCFVGLIYETGKVIATDGFYATLCDPQHKYNDGKMAFWMYIYYLSKFVELIDTLLIIMRRSQLRFIHTYHHVTTMFIAYFGSYMHGTGQWIPISVNTFVHILMYWYYLQVTIGNDVWWKGYLTDIQLVQFVIDAVVAFSGHIFSNYYWEYPRGNTCSGSEWGAWAGNFIVISFFILFFQLRQKNARAVRAKQEAAKKSQ